MKRNLEEPGRHLADHSYAGVVPPAKAGILVLVITLLIACGGGGNGTSDDPVTYIVTANAELGGSIDPASASVGHGSVTTFTVTPDTGYSIAGVSGCGGSLEGTTYTTAPVTADCTVTASFALDAYTVTANAELGGSIDPAIASVSHGTVTTFTVTPDTGYSVAGVSGCDGRLEGTTYTTASITADCTVTASFVLNAYTVTANAELGGGIDPAIASVSHGSVTIFTVAPDADYSIAEVSGCGGSLEGTTYTTAPVTADCTVTASFSLPTVGIENASVVEGQSALSTLVFTITLDGQANGDVTVDYATVEGTAFGASSCAAGIDYVDTSGTLTIPAGLSSKTLSVPICADTVPESDDLFTIALSNVSANAELGSSTATGTIVADDPFGRLNDTGGTACGDYAVVEEGGSGLHQNTLDCAAVGATTTANGTDTDGDPVPAAQDAHFGRDVTHNDSSDGHAGFSFTKIGSAGRPLAIQNGAWDEAGSEEAGTKWACVLDNVTGLVWEMQVNDSTSLHHRDWTYTWYNSDPSTNGSVAGAESGGTCLDPSKIGCDTEKFVSAVNAAGLCGASDWRLPTIEELRSIALISPIYPIPGGRVIDVEFFPNTSSGWYWSSESRAANTQYAMAMSFYHGLEEGGDKNVVSKAVRLVRGGR